MDGSIAYTTSKEKLTRFNGNQPFNYLSIYNDHI